MRNAGEAVELGPVIPSLVRWGRSPDADLVYRTLLTSGPDTVEELARDLGLPPGRVAAALDELASVNAVRSRPTRARRARVWVPRPAGAVTSELRRPCHAPVAARPPQPEALPAALRAASLPVGDGLRHLPSRALTRARLGELVQVACHEHLAMNPEPAFEAQAARPAVGMDRALLDRGVTMRVVGVQSVDRDPLTEHGRDATEARPDYREASSVPMKLFVVDRRIALFPVAPGDPERGYLEVAQPPLVSALVALFERHWSVAQPSPTPGAAPLTPRERALVALLAAGHTDDAAARRLRISTRTVSNVIRDLMDRVGAGNRFQLGLLLGARYAISPQNGRPLPPPT
ncbi:MAG TPA: LuxR C-terminal-related transcriptional regulator [Pilimelia sp.]|nr:LuxR C-terminal-related transcriptional regulator [Pilimelia sp.]